MADMENEELTSSAPGKTSASHRPFDIVFNLRWDTVKISSGRFQDLLYLVQQTYQGIKAKEGKIVVGRVPLSQVRLLHGVCRAQGGDRLWAGKKVLRQTILKLLETVLCIERGGEMVRVCGIEKYLGWFSWEPDEAPQVSYYLSCHDNARKLRSWAEYGPSGGNPPQGTLGKILTFRVPFDRLGEFFRWEF